MSSNSNFQIEFERKRGHLHDTHVRDLAWLLDSPDLLDPAAPQWKGKVATLFNHQGQRIDDWLIALDRAPAPLHALIDAHGFARLGRYSELLMAFFLREFALLHAHGLQVRADKRGTIGEFDFLLYRDADNQRQLHHWEFATKFYLLEVNGTDRNADFLVGPNLADTLGAKMRKILDRQLSLSQHLASAALLPQAVDVAQALVKGWLFTHPADDFSAEVMAKNGVSREHCRGYWRALGETRELTGEQFVLLPRLSWMAPARHAVTECMNKAALIETLHAHFANDEQPVMVATMQERGEFAIEIERGFIVPDDWRQRASVFTGQRA